MRRFRVLDTGVQVTTDHPELAKQLALLTRAYPVAEQADVSYRLCDAPACILRNDESHREAQDARDLLPTLEMEWIDEAVRNVSNRWVLHAAAVVTGGRAWVLCGRSGAGKTTTTLGLLQAGATYLTDEVTALDPTGVLGIPRLLRVTPVAPAPPLPFSPVVFHVTDRQGRSANEEFFVPPASPIREKPVPLGAIICLRYDPAGDHRLNPLRAAEALPRLWSDTLHVAAQTLDVALAVLAQTSFYELVSSDLAAAVKALGSLYDSG